MLKQRWVAIEKKSVDAVCNHTLALILSLGMGLLAIVCMGSLALAQSTPLTYMQR